MEVIHSKQQNVLKRKVEEAVALNKRLKDALALRKATQEAKHHGKSEKMGHWIKQEFDVHMHLVEAEATLSSLLEDRAMLQQQLNKLKEKSDHTDDVSQIRSIEEDIELRSVQIQDLQQKILDSDDDNKKSKFDNVQTMGEAKFALKILLEQTTEIKKSEVMTKNKFFEMQASITELKQKSESLEKVLKIVECKHSDEVSCMQKEYEEKIAVLLRQLRGVEVEDPSEELKQRCTIQAEKIDTLDKSNQELLGRLFESEQQIKNLQEKLDTITNMAQESQIESLIEEAKTPLPMPRKKRPKIKKEIDSTFVLENQENVDVSFEDMDDIEKDPDWKRTPIGKWILENKRRATQRNQSSDSDELANKMSLKRTSEGGCMCSKSNCSNRCGCRRTHRKCSSACKCPSSCGNRCASDLDDSDKFEENEKRSRLFQQTLFR